jgi:hypothetical protein
MCHKSETQSLLQSFIHLVENQFSTKVKILRSDNDPEFGICSFYLDKGIVHQTSCVATLQQNGVVEHKHRHLFNVSQSLLFQAHLSIEFQEDAILTATYLINQTPTTLLAGKSPYDLYTTNSPIIHIYVFLGVSALLILTPKYHLSSIPMLHVVFFLVTLMAKKDTTFTILIIINHLSPVMFSFIRTNFLLLIHLPRQLILSSLIHSTSLNNLKLHFHPLPILHLQCLFPPPPNVPLAPLSLLATCATFTLVMHCLLGLPNHSN